ncbi:MAG: ABC transporter substrate-binding protein, partial [Actinobacteria bacterium]|nr:ABC transporter substrate-binding protein [Actinomycetota bacterium]
MSELAVVVLTVAVVGSGCAGNAARNGHAEGNARLGTEGRGAAAVRAGDAMNGTVGATEPGGANGGSAAVPAPAGSAGSALTSETVAGPKRASAAAAAGPTTAGSAHAVTGRAAGATPTAAAGPAGRAAASGSPSSSSAAPAPAPAPPPVPASGSTVGVTRDTVTIGLVYPKTGFYAGLLRNAPTAVQAAIDEAGPINGRRVVVKTYDDGSYNTSTIQVEEKRAKDEAFGLISLVSESNTILAPLVDRHRVPMVAGNMDRDVAMGTRYVFPLFAYWAYQATLLPDFIRNVLGGGAKRIGIVYEGTSTAKAAKEAFKAKAATLGEKVVFEQPIATNQATCANEVSNLQAHDVELVFLMNGPLGGICMLRDAKALGYRPTWTSVGTTINANAVASATGGGADGIKMFTSGTTLDTPAGRRFSEVMRQKAPNSGAADDDVMLYYYGLARGFLEGLRRTGPDLTRESFVSTFETKMSGYDSGYLPPPTFGPGDRSGPTSVGVTRCCQNNRWVIDQPGWQSGFPATASFTWRPVASGAASIHHAGTARAARWAAPRSGTRRGDAPPPGCRGVSP